MTNPPLDVIAHTRAWVDRAVIGLNLCPFAKAPQVKGLVRYVLCPARDVEGLFDQLVEELLLLARTPATQIETTLLIHPGVLNDFLDYNEFLDAVDGALTQLQLDGVLQVAGLHPRFQFADTEADDLGNATNRSPYPTLHLLREESVDRAVEAIADPSAIFATNIETMTRLGSAGWARLQQDCADDARQPDGTGAPPAAA